MNSKIVFLFLITLPIVFSCVEKRVNDDRVSRVEEENILLKNGDKIPLDFNNIDKIYYLIRHAEKVKDGSDNPVLSELGQERSLLLSDIFWKSRLDNIFVTMTNRTIQTADTLIRIKKKNMRTYDGKKLEEFAQNLKNDTSFKSAMIVGHSNTTPALAKLLAGGDHEFPKIPESDYNNIYVVVESKGKTESYTLKYN